MPTEAAAIVQSSGVESSSMKLPRLFSAEQMDAGRDVCRLFTAAVSALCLGLAFWYFGWSLSTHREHKLAACVDAITEWNTVGRAQFNLLDSVQISVGGESHTMSMTVGSGEIVDNVDKTVAKELPPYIVAKYEAVDSILPTAEYDSEVNATVSLAFTTNFKDETPFTLSVPPMRLWKKRFHRRANMKNCRYIIKGSWSYAKEFEGHGCVSYYRAATICAALEKGDIGQGYELVGCTPDSKFVAYVQVHGANREGVEVGLTMEGVPKGEVQLADVPIEFRSAEDPFILVQRVTGGTLKFGETSEHMRFVAGMLLLASVILAGPCCVWTCKGFLRDSIANRSGPEYEDLFGEGDDL